MPLEKSFVGKLPFLFGSLCTLGASRHMPRQPLLPRRTCVAVCLVLVTLAAAVTAVAQTSKTSGTLEGTVSDASGGRIAGVKITLRETDTNQTRTIDADDQGFFRATDLPVGTYEVRIADPKFAPYLHMGVDLDVGTTVHLDISLPPASVTTQVTVSAQPSPLDPSQTSVTSAIDRERIEDLPVLSRNALDFVLLLPGVTNSSQGGNPRTRSVLGGSGFSFGGLRPRSNNISVDGLDNNDEFTGSSRTELSPERCPRISGSEQRHLGGIRRRLRRLDQCCNAHRRKCHPRRRLRLPSGRGSQRPRSIPNNAWQSLFSALPPWVLHRWTYQLRNRTFFHAALEQESNRGQMGSEIDPSLASAINNFLAGGSFPGLKTRQITTGFSPIARAETEAFGQSR